MPVLGHSMSPIGGPDERVFIPARDFVGLAVPTWGLGATTGPVMQA